MVLPYHGGGVAGGTNRYALAYSLSTPTRGGDTATPDDGEDGAVFRARLQRCASGGVAVDYPQDGVSRFPYGASYVGDLDTPASPTGVADLASAR